MELMLSDFGSEASLETMMAVTIFSESMPMDWFTQLHILCAASL